jgi:TonB family protein
MKTCPTCGAKYSDDLSFCLQDGNRLVVSPTSDISSNPTEQFRHETAQQPDISASETVVANPQLAAPSTRRYQLSAVDPSSKMGCVVTVGVLGLVVVSGFALIASYYSFGSKSSDVAMNDPKYASNANRANMNVSAAPSTDSSSNSMSNTIAPTHTETANVANTVPTPVSTRKNSPTPAPTQEVKTVSTPPPTPEPTQQPVVTKNPGERNVVAGGNLNARAISLPQPPYPPAARAVRAGGMVAVRVLIDERGNVIAAEAIRGHPLLRASAVGAARAARFAPVTIGGEPVRMRGVLTYNFIP